MSLRSMLTQPLTIHHRGPTAPPTKDDYGNEITVETGAEEVNGYAEQTDAQEITVDRETYATNWRVFLLPGVVIGAWDWIDHGARSLEVIGRPNEVWNPRTASVHHIEVQAREVIG